MWMLLLALFEPNYVQMLRDPGEMRYCLVASEYAAARAAEGDAMVVDAAKADEMIRFFRRAQGTHGSADEAFRAALAATMTDAELAAARFATCVALADAAATDPAITDLLPASDVMGMAAEAMQSAEPLDGEETIDAAALFEIDGAPILAALSEPRRREVRCATIASALMYDVGRGVSDRSYGLTAASAETLAGRLAEAIMSETGMRETEVRAAYKADFEEFTLTMLGDGQDEKTALAMVEAGIKQCQPLYDSIDLSGDGDGLVSGLTPAAMLGGAAAPDAAHCYAIMARFLPGLPKGSKEAKAFGDIVARLEQRHYAEHGQTAEAAADLAGAVAGFDDAAFEALPEAEAETQMGYCMDMAGSS